MNADVTARRIALYEEQLQSKDEIISLLKQRLAQYERKLPVGKCNRSSMPDLLEDDCHVVQ